MPGEIVLAWTPLINLLDQGARYGKCDESK